MHLYFRNIKIVGIENIPNRGAVLFLPNHQNALIDALLLVTNISRRTYFVARADVFKNKRIKWLLSWLYMMPIYRMRDGIQTLSGNKEIIDNCVKILVNGDALTIFPEGNHSFERRLRPLSRGFTRIVLGALAENPELKLKIVPVGINYAEHSKFRTSVGLYFGAPILVKVKTDDFNQASNALKQQVAIKMSKLITHIEDELHYDEIYTKLLATRPDFTNPLETNLRLKELDKFPAQSQKEKNNWWSAVLKLPVWFNNLIPLLVWLLVKRQIKDPVMEATIKFAYGITLIPVVYLAQGAALAYYLNEWVAILYILVSVITLPLLAVKK